MRLESVRRRLKTLRDAWLDPPTVEHAFLPAALEIVETPASPLGRGLGYFIVITVVTLGLWSSSAEVDVIAVANGTIVADSRNKLLQAAEPGVVRAIHVHDGDQVIAGDPLIDLDVTQNAADQKMYTVDLRRARLDLARLNGVRRTLHGEPRAPTLIDPPADAAAAELDAARAAMLAEVDEFRARVSDWDSQIAFRESQLEEANAEIAKLEKTVPMAKAQFEVHRDAMANSVGSRLNFLNAQERLLAQEAELSIAPSRKHQASAALTALRRQRSAFVAGADKQILEAIRKAQAEASAAESGLVKARQRVSLQQLRAPASGRIQQIATHTLGGVVSAAESLAVIVPDDGKLSVRVAIANDDIGFVQAGQPVQIKVQAFDFTRFGLVNGRVVEVSADVATSMPSSAAKDEASMDLNQRDVSAYVAKVELDEPVIRLGKQSWPLRTGMAVIAEIQTGRRSVIGYFLSPIAKSASESFHER